MDLLQLRYFQTVARLEHVSRASEELRVAQPSLSRTIGRLENELGVPLFDRQGRTIRLNRYGSMFLGRIESVLRDLDDACREVTEQAGQSRGRVAVASETLLLATNFIAAFLAENPDVDLRLFQSSMPTMIEQLESGEVDVCLVSQPLAGEHLESVELFSERVLLAVPAAHRLARKRRVAVDDFLDESFVTTRVGFWQRALLEHLFSGVGRQPAIACESGEPGAIRGLVSAGLGIGLLPAISRQTTGDPHVGWLDVEHPDCRRALRLAWRNDRFLSAAAVRFRDTAAQTLRFDTLAR